MTRDDSAAPRTTRQRIEALCAERGRPAVVAGCIALLERREVDGELIVGLGGRPARWVLTGERGGPPYWLRVWAARGLLHAWSDEASSALRLALTDEAWRVREMGARVVARYRLEAFGPTVGDLQDDAVPRVRAAAVRAHARLAEHARGAQSGSAR